MSDDELRRPGPPPPGRSRRWWAVVPLIVVVVAPLIVVFSDQLGVVGVLIIVAIGIAAESLAVRMAIRPSTN